MRGEKPVYEWHSQTCDTLRAHKHEHGESGVEKTFRVCHPIIRWRLSTASIQRPRGALIPRWIV